MAGLRLSIGVGLDLATLWRQLGQVQTALAAAAAKQTNFAVAAAASGGAAGGGGGAPAGSAVSGGSNLFKDLAAAAVAAKAAAGTIASPFLSLRVEMRTMGMETAARLREGAKDLDRAGKFLGNMANETAVKSGRARQADMERFSEERKARAAAKAERAAQLGATQKKISATGVEIIPPSAINRARAGLASVSSAYNRLRAIGADMEVNMIRRTRELGVALERVGKIARLPIAALRGTIGAVKGVVSMFMSYEDRVGKVAKKMGLLETVTRAAANVASAPFKAAGRAQAGAGGGGGISGLAGKAALGGAVAGAAAAAGLGLAIKAGSDLNETVSKVETVFGDAAGTVKGDAAQMAADFGVNNDTFMDSAASIGLIGKAAGQSEAQAAKFGSQFSKLSLDMMSFYNVPVDEAMKAVRSGLVGETEPMRRFGVLLSADRVEAEAFRMGIAQVGEELTEGQKVQARSSLIMKGLSDAQGDLARTADQPANLMRTLQGRLGGVATTIGQAVMPGVQSFLSLLNQMAMDAEANSGGVVAAFEWIGGAIQSAVESIGVIYRNWGDYQDILAATVEARMVNIAEVVGWLQSVFGAVLNWILENWTTILPDAFEAVKTAIMNLGENIRNFFTELWDFIKSGGRDPIEFEWTPIMKGAQFQSGAFVMPELKLSGPDQARLDAANERINKRETDRINAQEAKGPVKRGTLKEGEDEGNKKKSDLGRTLDLSAFREQLQQGLFDKDKQRGVKAQEKAADGIDKLNGKVDELNGNVKKINVGMQ